MSYLNQQVVALAFQKTGIVAESDSPSAEQGQTGLTVMNALLADHAADGVHLGYYPQTDLSAESPLQDSDVNGVVLLLARSLASHYGITLGPELPRPSGPYGGYWGGGS